MVVGASLGLKQGDLVRDLGQVGIGGKEAGQVTRDVVVGKHHAADVGKVLGVRSRPIRRRRVPVKRYGVALLGAVRAAEWVVGRQQVAVDGVSVLVDQRRREVVAEPADDEAADGANET